MKWPAMRDRRLYGDPRRLSQVLANLTANAVEHGSGEVSLQAVETADGVRVEVRDEGGPARSVPVAGRGRGLKIAADAARDLGGRLTVERTEDGTVAAVDLPAAEHRGR
jgi:signal transduction histidine kinase